VREGVHPDDITAPQSVVPAVARAADAAPEAHHHAGPPSDHASPPGHHVADAVPAPPGRRRGLLAVAGVTAGVLVLATVGTVALQRAGGATVAGSSQPPAPAASSFPAVGLTPAASAPADATDTATPPLLPPAQDTLVLGDSLGLVVYPWLADLLPDRFVSYQAEVGRSTPATEKILSTIGAPPPLVIVSSGTNDPVANVFEESARRILDLLGPKRCVVWVDIVRPDRVGDAQTAMNAALERAVVGRPNVRILHWTQLVAAHPEWMSADGIHPNEAGSQGRAAAFAQAAQGCSALDPNAPPARRQVLPKSAFWGPVSGQYRPPSGSGQTSSSSRTATSAPSSPSSPRPTSPPGSTSAAASTSAPAPPPVSSSAPAPTASSSAPPSSPDPPTSASGSPTSS